MHTSVSLHGLSLSGSFINAKDRVISTVNILLPTILNAPGRVCKEPINKRPDWVGGGMLFTEMSLSPSFNGEGQRTVVSIQAAIYCKASVSQDSWKIFLKAI